MKVQHALSALPFIGILGRHLLRQPVEPYVLGLPFALFWVTLWVLLTAAIMAIVYRLDHRGDR